MRIGPAGLATILIAEPQEEALETMAGASLIGDGVGTSPHQVAHRLIDRIGHMDGIEFTRAVQARERDGIAPVGLDALALLLGNEGRGDDNTLDLQLLETALDDEAARTCLVDHV